MATIAWPTTIAFVPATFEIGLRSNVLLSTSPLTGATQTVEIPGARWVGSMTLTPCTQADQAVREALLAQIAGQANRVALWHFARPVPRGTMRGSPTLSATAAAGATTLQIANAFGTNLLKYTQQFDNAYWIKTRATVTADAAIAPDGTLTADKLVEDTTAANSHALRADNVPTTPGQRYTASVYAQAAERTAIRVLIQEGINTANTVWTNFDLVAGSKGSTFYGGSGADGSAAIESVGSGWYRCSVSGLVAPAATSLDVVVQPIVGGTSLYDGDGTSGLYIWGAQLERGSAASAYDPYATLKAGDMISAGGQPVQVVADATAGADAVITASIRPALRAQVAAGTAVLWDKPTATFILTSPEVRVGYRPAVGEEIVLDFMEVFA